MRPRHTRKLLTAVLGVVVLAAAWFYLAPLSLGGKTSYVVTHGVSMQPKFHSGDLAVVRAQGTYHVGEIVAYNSTQLHTIVLHRIIGMSGNRYVFKGDNNNFIDFEHPARNQLLGALWLHVPSVGGTLASIASPLLVAALIGLGVVLYAGAMVRKRRRRQRHRREGAAAPAATARTDGPAGPMVAVLVAGTIAMLPFLLLALLAFTRETTRRTPYQAAYHQHGSLTYRAAATPGPAYQQGQAVTGEPLFTHVIGTAQLHFSYRFASKEPHTVAGVISMSALLTSTSGWQHTIPLARPTAFRGDHASVDATLDLGSMLALLKRVQTDTAANGTYMLLVQPHVSTTGHLAGVPMSGTFAPQIKFSVEPAEVRPLVPGDGAATGESSGGHGANPLTPQAGGTVEGSRWEPLYLSLGFAHPTVATARRIALGGIAVVVVAIMFALAFPFTRPRRRDEADSIRRRYGRLIVPVERVWELPGVQVIDVADIESLVRIAEHYDRSILHETTPDGEAFWVTDESGQFRYAVPREAGTYAAPSAPATFEWPVAEAPAAEAHLADETVDAPAIADEPDLAPAAVAAAEVGTQAVPDLTPQQEAEPTHEPATETAPDSALETAAAPAVPERTVEPAAAPAGQEWSVTVTPTQEPAPVIAPSSVVAAAYVVAAEMAPEPAALRAPEPAVVAPDREHAAAATPEPAVAPGPEPESVSPSSEPVPAATPDVPQVLMPFEPPEPPSPGVDLVSFGPVDNAGSTAPPASLDPPTVEQPAAAPQTASFSVQPPAGEPAGLSPSEAAAATFAAASRARAAGEDPWAEQVVSEALEHGSADWRAACEAAGVVFDAPRSSRR
jgi:signal peptidase I